MVGTKKATKEQVVVAILFCLFFFGPLFLIPVFPKSHILQAINSNGVCILLLAAFAACTSGLIAWIAFRGKSVQ